MIKLSAIYKGDPQGGVLSKGKAQKHRGGRDKVCDQMSFPNTGSIHRAVQSSL